MCICQRLPWGLKCEPHQTRGMKLYLVLVLFSNCFFLCVDRVDQPRHRRPRQHRLIFCLFLLELFSVKSCSRSRRLETGEIADVDVEDVAAPRRQETASGLELVAAAARPGTGRRHGQRLHNLLVHSLFSAR